MTITTTNVTYINSQRFEAKAFMKIETLYTVSESTEHAAIRHDKFSVFEVYNGNANNNGTAATTNNISYTMGALVLTGATNVHIVYYGNWTTNQQNIVNTFISTIGSTSWFNIEKTYYFQISNTSSKVYTTGPLTLGNTTTNNYTNGTQLTGTSIKDIIYNHITKGQLPNDQRAIYLLLSSSDVKENSTTTSSFCNSYCGYHSTFSRGTSKYIYGFIGNPQKCINSCSVYNKLVSPNGDVGVDAMLTPVAHEIVEAMSDPWLNAWRDINKNENADKW
ncbi:unnamed protein product [Rotaria sp. Silwood2]|nr:unnamed protein product [Rotaria sp. Silwood2]